MNVQHEKKTPNPNILLLSFMLNFNNFPLTKSYAAIYTLAHKHAYSHTNNIVVVRVRLFPLVFFFCPNSPSSNFFFRSFVHPKKSFENVRKWVSKRGVGCAYEFNKVYFMGNFHRKLYTVVVVEPNKKSTTDTESNRKQRKKERKFFLLSLQIQCIGVFLFIFQQNFENDTFKSVRRWNELFNTHFQAHVASHAKSKCR